MKRICEIHNLARHIQTTHEAKTFNTLVRKFKNELMQKLPHCTFTGFKPNHFTVTGFIKNTQTNKVCYVSLSDVRYNFNATNHILYRTAKDFRDYTGGHNQYASLENLASAIAKVVN